MSSAAVPAAASAAPRVIDFAIHGMTCAACAARVEKKLNAMTDVSAVLNLATEQAWVTAPASVSAQRLIDAVEQAGYGAAIPLAAAGFLNPLIAGAAMALSSAFVVGNSVRLRRFGGPTRAAIASTEQVATCQE